MSVLDYYHLPKASTLKPPHALVQWPRLTSLSAVGFWFLLHSKPFHRVPLSCAFSLIACRDGMKSTSYWIEFKIQIATSGMVS